MKTLKLLTIALSAVTLVAVVDAQRKPAARPAGVQVNRAENSLVGVKLMDPGVKLINMFGSPDEIQPISFGAGPSTTSNVSGQRGGGQAGGRVPGGGGAPGGGGGGGAAMQAEWNLPGIIGNPFDEPLQNRQLGIAPGDEPQGGPGSRPSAAGAAGPGGGGRGVPSAAGAGPGGGGGGGAASGERVIYTRWVYRRGGGRYAFVLDKFNKVVQIEAIGLNDAKVKTRRGIGLGSTFGELIKKYSAPDAYEIGGDQLMIRYLVKDKVAFRLSRTEANKPHRVTGIVVAAGKS